MSELERILLEEEKKLKHILLGTKKEINSLPEGALRISKSNNRVRYYHRKNKNDLSGSYISKENIGIARDLAQRAYDQRIIDCAESKLADLTLFTKNFFQNEIEQIFYDENEERQKLIHPVICTWQKFLDDWASEEYKGKSFQEGSTIIMSERGERVRSKTEKILADYFYYHDIKYKYEHPLYLKGLGFVYPDFTFLSPKTRKEIYWEHFGMMDDPKYAKLAIKKISAYEENGFYLGENLIVTFETNEKILSHQEIERNVQRFLTI